MISGESLQELYEYLHKLKQLNRSGWVRNKVKNSESVADHSFSLAILAMLVAQQRGLNVEKAMKIALIHDLGESIIGDLTPHDGVDKKEKHHREKAALKEILARLQQKEELIGLWQEFEDKSSPEAKLVAQLDKLDAYLQARNYRLPEEGLNEFMNNARENIDDPELSELLDNLV